MNVPFTWQAKLVEFWKKQEQQEPCSSEHGSYNILMKSALSKFRTPLMPDRYYHIYNRGNNRENLFVENRNYAYFLRLYKKYISPIAFTLAYSLLPNHFHFLVRMKPVLEFQSLYSRQFASFFGTYSKTINKAYNRTGRLFEGRFKRKLVRDDEYLTHLVVYIHLNPQKHGLVSYFKDWRHSSFRELTSSRGGLVARALVFEKFGGLENFQKAHLEITNQDAALFNWKEAGMTRFD